MSEVETGIPSSKSYGQMLTEYHEQISSQLSNNASKMNDIQPLFAYLKLLRKMRSNDSALSFIDELNLKICTIP